MKPRLPYLVAVLVVIACGLAWRRPEFGLPWPVAKYGGSILWGAMTFFCVGVVAPRLAPSRMAAIAAIVAAAVETSQLIRYAPLDAFRATTIGALLLGRTFSWWDIASYWAGIALAWVAAAIAARAR